MPENETAPVGQDKGGGNKKTSSANHTAFVQRWRSAICARECTLNATPRHVGLALSLYANVHGANAYPSEDALAAACALSTRAVRKSLLALEAGGWIRREKRIGQGKAWCWHVYTLLLPDGAERRSLPKRKGAELGSLPEEAHGPELDSAPNADGAERRSTRTGTSFQDGPEPRSADLDLKLACKSNLEERALSSDGKAVWSKALSLLTKSGLQESKARSVIGKLRKTLRNDDTTLVELVNEAERQQIAKPEAWLMAAVARRQASPFARVIPASEAQANADADRALALFGAAP